MQPVDLEQHLADMGLSQAELARLVSVTPRAIQYYVTGERDIPGPLAAYVELLAEVPEAARRHELGKIFERRNRAEAK